MKDIAGFTVKCGCDVLVYTSMSNYGHSISDYFFLNLVYTVFFLLTGQYVMRCMGDVSIDTELSDKLCPA